MLSTAESANVRFLQVVQLRYLPQPQTQLTQKIPFINLEKKFLGVNQVRANIS